MNLDQLKNASRYDKSGLLKYIKFKDEYQFILFYNNDWEININNSAFTSLTRQNGELRLNKNDTEFTRLKNLLKRIKSRKIEQEVKEMNLADKHATKYVEKKIYSLQTWLFQLYCLHEPSIKFYQILKTGKANPGDFQTERERCLKATSEAKKIKVTIEKGYCTNIHSFSTRYYPMPKILINNSFIDKINNSCIANRFDINKDEDEDKNEDSELIFKKGLVFDTLRNIIIESLKAHDKLSGLKQGRGERDSFTHLILKSLTGLYRLIKDYDLYIVENKVPTSPEEFICKLLFGKDRDKNIDKIKNFRDREKDGRTTFPITFFPD